MNTEMKLIRDRMRENCIKSGDVGTAESLLTRLIPGEAAGTARFSDLDYTICLNSNWPASGEIGRAATLASAYVQTGEKRFFDAAAALLDDWFTYFYTNPNWWHNVIGVPLAMGSCGLLLWDELDETRRAGIRRVLEQGSFSTHPDFMEKFTGANLIWIAGVTVRLALLCEDEPLLKKTIARVAEEIVIGANEGIQEDGSFFQHGRQLYSSGYGRAFVSEITNLIYPLRGTSYQFAAEKLEMILHHVLDGLRYMIHKGSLDIASTGREYTRESALHINGGYIETLEKLAAVEEMPRRDELAAHAKELREKAPLFPCVRYFPTAAFLVAHYGKGEDATYISFMGTNPTLVGAEIINEEGVMGYNLSYGTRVSAMHTGEEYFNIAPIWDYAKMPGTTARDEDDETLYKKNFFPRRRLAPGHFGGGQTNDTAVIFQDTDHETIHGRAAAIAAPEGMIFLGCRISDDEGAKLYTTLEQANYAGDYKVEGGDVYHGGFVYRNLDASCELSAEVRTQSGAWTRNNRQRSDKSLKTGEVFRLVTEPKDGHYAYAILPKGNAGASVEVLKNDEDAQIVRISDGRILGVFYKEGKYELCEKIFDAKADELLLG